MVNTLEVTLKIEKMITAYETRAEAYKTIQLLNEVMVRDLKELKETIKKNG